ncbi:MAG TPA: proline iminopeptidase-family hydrolase [Myxococcota bacterium]|nr:proline iminopeptidase-family hydrolase [Myxococcota bacterium]
MSIHRLVIAAFLLLAGVACATQPLASGERFLDAPGGRIWVHVAGSGRGTPLLVLHGGPGASSAYLRSLEVLGDERPVVFYDQLGGGKSERPDDASLWTLERFARELAGLREQLGLRRVHVLGHSWGATLAAEHVLGGARGVESVVFASPLLSTELWMRDANALRARLPAETQAVLAAHEAAGTTDSPAYQAAAGEYYQRHLVLRRPLPPELREMSASINQQIYATMWGPSEFTVTGNLKGYDARARLPRLRMPVLFIAGRSDEATPASAAELQRLVPGAELVVLEHSAHMTPLDEPEAFAAAIRAFLREADAR